MQEFEDKAHDVKQSSLNRSVQDKFLFFMNLPDCLKNSPKQYVADNKEAGINRDKITISLVSANIPRITVRAQPLPYGGGNVYISSHTREPYEPLTIKFNIDNEYNNYFTLYEWLNFIYDEREGRFDANDLTKGNTYIEYANNLGIAATDEYNNVKVLWSFKNAFINNLSDLQLSYQEHGEITCQASFVFSQMYVKNFRLEGLKRGVDSKLLI